MLCTASPLSPLRPTASEVGAFTSEDTSGSHVHSSHGRAGRGLHSENPAGRSQRASAITGPVHLNSRGAVGLAMEFRVASWNRGTSVTNVKHLLDVLIAAAVGEEANVAVVSRECG